MSPPERVESYDVTCPHCRKRFAGSLLDGDRARLRGFKCPHCKLFFPQEPAVPAEGERP